MPEPSRASQPAPADAAAATTTSSETGATRKRARSTPPKSRRYVDLGEDAPVMSSWKNDPSYMKLETYFSENQKGMLKSYVLFFIPSICSSRATR